MVNLKTIDSDKGNEWDELWSESLKEINDMDCGLKEMNEIDYGLKEVRLNIIIEVNNVTWVGARLSDHVKIWYKRITKQPCPLFFCL